ncbi:MAG: LytTR family transcriptional regulator, partial [Clostridia bacterium]|nr:LytTR family transcriptional regulator [Clostridia bacterium]
IEKITNELLEDFDAEVYHLRHRGEIINIDYNNIIFVESCNSKCLLHCTSGDTHTVYKRLCDIEDELCDSRFLRCHQSYLINMNHIVYADKSFRTDNGETVLIRQKNLKEIKDIYYRFLK